MPKTQATAKAPPVDGRRVLAYTDPATLQPYDRNARTHTDEQVRQIRASIEQFGFNAPILLKEDGSTIGAGHGRWMAAMLDPPLPEVPVITLRGLSEAQWRAYVIADNKIALNSVWNDELLRSELADLERQGVNLAIAGFTPEELDAIHRGWDSDLGALERIAFGEALTEEERSTLRAEIQRSPRLTEQQKMHLNAALEQRTTKP